VNYAFLTNETDIIFQEDIVKKELYEMKTTEELFKEIKNNLTNNETINLEILGQKFNFKNSKLIPFFLVSTIIKENNLKNFMSLSLKEEDINLLKNYLIKSGYSSKLITNLLKDTTPNKSNNEYKYIWYKSFNIRYLKELCKEENIEFEIEENYQKIKCIFINKNIKTKKILVKEQY